jgi:hypothetical protein
MNGRLVVLVASCALIVTACGSVQPSPTPGVSAPPVGPTPTANATASAGPAATGVAVASSAPAAVPSGMQHVVTEVLALDAPASWHVEKGLINPSGSETWTLLGPSALPDMCEPIGQGTTECHPWPIMQLEPGSIVAAVRSYGMPGSKPPTGGRSVKVSGDAARWIRGVADATCREIGGSAEDQIVIPRGSGGAWLSLDGCLAGPDTTGAEASFSALVPTLKVAH